MPIRPRAAASLLSLLTLTGALLGPSVEPAMGDAARPSPRAIDPSAPRGNGVIAFTTFRTGDNEIFVMNADGSRQADLSNNSASDSQPAWSPDGAKVAFTSNRTGNNDVWVMNADGSGQADLSNDSASDSQPAWSPDGTKVAFTSNRTGNNDVWVMNADGSGQADLSKDPA
ncbi:MAG: hypothetical protein E6G40_03585, partial [Actinobacteria bacterium]